MGRIILVSAFKYAAPKGDDARARSLARSRIVHTPPTLLAACRTHINVLAPWITAKDTSSFELVSFLVDHAPTFAFALRVAVNILVYGEWSAVDTDATLTFGDDNGNNTRRDAVVRKRELECVELTNRLVKRCFQLTELVYETQGAGSLFQDNYSANRRAFIDAICSTAKSIQELVFPSYLTARPTFTDEEVSMLRESVCPWRRISLECAFYMTDALFERLFGDRAPFCGVTKLVLTHSDITNKSIALLPKTLQTIQLDGTSTVKDAVAAWRDLVTRCALSLTTFSTYEFPTSEEALLQAANMKTQFVALRKAKFFSSRMNSRCISLLMEMLPAIEELRLSRCLPQERGEDESAQHAELDPLLDCRHTLRSLSIDCSAVVSMKSFAVATHITNLYLEHLPHLDLSTLTAALAGGMGARLEQFSLLQVRGAPPVWLEREVDFQSRRRHRSAGAADTVAAALAASAGVPRGAVDWRTPQGAAIAEEETRAWAAFLEVLGGCCVNLTSLNISSTLTTARRTEPNDVHLQRVAAAPPGSLEAFFATAKIKRLHLLTLRMHGVTASVLRSITRSAACRSSLSSLTFFSECRRGAGYADGETDFGPKIGAAELAELFSTVPTLASLSISNQSGVAQSWYTPRPDGDDPADEGHFPPFALGATCSETADNLIDILERSLRAPLTYISLDSVFLSGAQLKRLLSLPFIRTVCSPSLAVTREVTREVLGLKDGDPSPPKKPAVPGAEGKQQTARKDRFKEAVCAEFKLGSITITWED